MWIEEKKQSFVKREIFYGIVHLRYIDYFFVNVTFLYLENHQGDFLISRYWSFLFLSLETAFPAIKTFYGFVNTQLCNDIHAHEFMISSS